MLKSFEAKGAYKKQINRSSIWVALIEHKKVMSAFEGCEEMTWFDCLRGA